MEIDTAQQSMHVNMSFESPDDFVNQSLQLLDSSTLKLLHTPDRTVKLGNLNKLN